MLGDLQDLYVSELPSSLFTLMLCKLFLPWNLTNHCLLATKNFHFETMTSSNHKSPVIVASKKS